MMKRILFSLFLATNGFSIASAEERLVIADFSSRSLAGWEKKVFSGETRYDLFRLDQQTVLKAVSENAASGLVKKIRVDLQQTPYLNWRWRTESRLEGMNERQKSGDDYVARIYVVVSGGLFFWRTLALNYVWSSNQVKGESWPNAFAGDNAIMLAVRSGEDDRSTWYRERRNVYEDMKRFHGKEIRFIDAIAVMTDTDNSHSRSVTYYGDIYFSSD